MELHLSDAERELLDDILREQHMVLQREAEHATNPEFRHMMRERQVLLESIIERIDVEQLASN